MCEDFKMFEGNAQAIRLVSKLHFFLDENGILFSGIFARGVNWFIRKKLCDI